MKNRILTDSDRNKFKSIIDKMFDALPKEMDRKISRANVQQAFMVDFIYPKFKDKKILCVGSFEDTAYEYLKTLGVKMVGIDPRINYDLNTYKSKTNEKFELIFSTSVIEHVENDEQFIRDICELLVVGGIGVLTTDFLEDQPVANIVDQFLTANGIKNGIRMGREKRMELRRLQDEQRNKATLVIKPKEDFRLYTSSDYKRITKILEKYNCFFVDEFLADLEPDFELFPGCKYSFSTMVFRKLR